MEAVPKLPMLSFELKVSPEMTHFGPKLKQYIVEAYRESPDSYSNEMHQLESLRATATRPTSDAGGLSHLNRYFCQLRAMQSRFPMAKGQPASVNFVWKDLYANMNCTSADIRFEMACVLYNIGALHTQLGASEPRTSADSLKAACSHFQQAAWSFQYLRENYPQPPGVDVAPDIMRFLQEICFAQAQECILDKSIQDTRKASVVGAVATQVMLFYKNSLAILGPSTGTDNIHEIIGTKLYNYWHRYLSFKNSYTGCIVSLYQGMNAEEQQKMGERVAFYQHAVDKLAEARKLAKYVEPVQITQDALTFTNDVVEGKRKAAKNENEFIYHEEVPDKDLLSDFKPVCLVKAVPINFSDPEVSGPDLFARLIPIGAHEASSLYSEEKAKLLRQIVNQAESKNTELLEFMSSLQLDQLDVLDSEQKIPEEIVDRCAAMNAKTEIIQSLVDSMNNLAEMISDVEHSLSDCKNLIQEETTKEKEYQRVIGPRPPSIVQTELSREFNKYQEAHARTNESNQVLHKAMTLHIANLKLLALPLDELEAKIPSIDNIESLDHATMREMRRVVSKAREMQSQRDALVHELRADLTADDVTAALLANSNSTAEEIFAKEIQKHTPKVKIIEQNLAAQENIINRLTSLYASYAESRRLLTDVLRKRDGLINALIASYDTYEELLGKSSKGLEFYKKMSLNVTQLLARLKSTCQVQDEERTQLMAKQARKESTPTPPPSNPAPPTADPTYTPKLKDYLPYMKSRGLARSVPTTGPPEVMPPDQYYPETIYPTSIRPAPVGSEATIDPSHMKYPDGYVLPAANPYNPYASYQPDAYTQPYPYPMTSKPYEVPKISEPEANSYNTSYTPPQYSAQMANPQMYNPYYTGTQDNSTAVTDSQNMSYNQPMPQGNMIPNQYNYDAYVPTSQTNPNVPDVVPNVNQPDLALNFAQMQVTPRNDPQPNSDYSQTYYSIHYPQVATPNNATYSHAPQNSNTNIVPSQTPSDYSSINYPYADQTVPNNSGYALNQANAAPNYPTPDSTYNYASTSGYENVAQAHAIYTNADNSNMYSSMSVTSTAQPNVSQPYSIPEQDTMNPAALAHLNAIDKPIKSHVTGEALSVNYYKQDSSQYVNPNEQTVPQTSNYYQDHTNVNFVQTYPNHPGYTFNSTSGAYEYSYGSQITNTNSSQASLDLQPAQQGTEWSAQGVYTSAGSCQTMQSPSETPQVVPEASNQNQIYYNSPYGYQTVVQTNEESSSNVPGSTNYGSTTNQSTYMQSGQPQESSVTFSNNQVPSPSQNVPEAPSYNQNVTVDQNVPQIYQSQINSYQNYQGNYQNQTITQETYQNPSGNSQVNTVNEPVVGNYQSDSNNYQSIPSTEQNAQNVQVQSETKSEPTVEIVQELSTFDLLSDIDFTVEHTPLKPEIKVPQVNESAIKKPIFTPKEEIPVLKPVVKTEVVIERPAKRDLFSDPSLLNKFTEEVKGLQKLVDSLSSKTSSGLTLLDSKWKTFQDTHANENMTRTKMMAMKHSTGSIVSEVVPYDDSRLTLQKDPDLYINASYYKQLSPWCIPLVISKCPSSEEQYVFWRAVLENKIPSVVCLVSEMEMQGNAYWPTAKGQTLTLQGDIKVTLEEVNCTVHWTQRSIAVASSNVVVNVKHYQINVFPAKIVCSPLVLLADKVLNSTYDNRLSNQLTPCWLHCSSGAGRSAVVALLVSVMCQVRAGQLGLCETLETSCANLCKHRTNVLEDPKYLQDAYRTALFYVQGVLCSGTTLFNGESVSVQSGASVFAPVPQTSYKDKESKMQKFSKESFEEMKQSPGLKSGDMKDPLNFLDPLWSLKKK